MKSKFFYPFFIVLLAASSSCSFLSQGAPSTQSVSTPIAVAAGDLSVEATSPVSVHLEWKAASGASGYKLEGRYGAEFFPIADLPGDQTSYDHFVVPGSAEITYRLNAGEKEIGTATATMPELAANPLRVGFQQVMPAMPTFSFPTIDPNNLDPAAIPTFDPSSFDPASLFKPVSVTQEVGPEGGTVTLTSPAGAVFTLDVPPGALRETVPFTLTPMESLSETPLPFGGGLLAAVQIQPVIPFEPMLTLHIQLAPDALAPAAPLVVGFDASGMSDELALHPIESEGDHTYSMWVDWGDTFGLAAATPQEIAAQVKRVPTDAGAQMAQTIVALQLLTPPPSAENTTIIADQILEALFAQLGRITSRNPAPVGRGKPGHSIAAPLPVKAIGDQQRSVAAQQLRAMIERAREGFYSLQGSPQARDLLTQLARRIKIFIDRVEKQCLTEDALYAQEIIDNLRRYMPDPTTENMFTGNAFWAALWLVYGPVQDLKPCNITLEIQSSTITGKDQYGHIKTVVSSQPIPLELVYEGDHLRLRGFGPVDYTEYEVFDSLCPPAKKLPSVPGTAIWITNLQPLFDPNDGGLVDFVLQRTMSDPITFPEGIRANVTASPPAQCRLLSLSVTKPTDVWGLGFAFLHNANPDQNWNIQLEDAGLTATKTVRQEVSNISEDSTLVIKVAPAE